MSCALFAREPTPSLEREMLRLEVELLSHDSATLVLEDWCRSHHISLPASIKAEPLKGSSKPPPEEVLNWLRADHDTVIQYRSVALRCGNVILSRADNWYRTDALTPEMLQRLATTQEPFGKVVNALDFHRQTLGVRPFWRPEIDRDPLELSPPPFLFEITALLRNRSGQPFSVVKERYTKENILNVP